MSRITLFALLFAALPLTSAFSQKASPAPATEPPIATEPPVATVHAPDDLNTLRPLLGQNVTVEATLASQSKSRNGNVLYLNYNANYRLAVSLVFFLRKDTTESVTEESLTAYVGKKVRAVGELSEHEGILQIKVQNLSQLTILE